MKKSEKKFYLSVLLTMFGAIALSILFFFLLFRIGELKRAGNELIRILMPFVYGGIMAYLLRPLCEKLESFFKRKLKGRRKGESIASGLSIFLSMFFGFAVVTALLILVLPQLISSIGSIVKMLPRAIEEFTAFLMNYVGDNQVLGNYVTEFSESISKRIPEWLSTSLLPSLQTLLNGFSDSVSGIVSVLTNVSLGLVVAVYLLGSWKKLANQGRMVIRAIFSPKWANRIFAELSYTDRMFSGFINGKILDSLLIGVLNFVGMLLLQLPYALLVSVLVGVTNLIPFFGPYIGMIPSAFLILLVNPWQCVLFLVFNILLQQFDGNVLGPRILGNVTGLSSFWVLFSILLFGGLFGFVGMIVGVPVFAVVYDIVRKLVRKGIAYWERKEGSL